MNSDAYTFAKSSMPQGVEEYTPYSAKSWNFVNDINSGVYSNNSGLTQVQFDMSSLYMSQGFIDTADTYLTIPIVMAAQFLDNAGATIAPTAGAFATCSLKSNYQHLIHQVEVVSDGKVINDTQPFVNLYQHFSLLSQMSSTDLAMVGESLGFSKELDNPLSLRMSQTDRVSLRNNVVLGSSTVPSSTIPVVCGAAGQNFGACNQAITQRVSRFPDLSAIGAGGSNKLYGAGATLPTLMTSAQFALEYRPNYTVVGTTMVWTDYAIIPMKYLCDCFDKIGLVRKFSSVIRLYLNTGSLSVTVAGTNSTALALGVAANSTFANTCPFTINTCAETTALGGNFPAACVSIAAGVFVARVPSTSIAVTGGTSNLGASAIASSMLACRLYYSVTTLELTKALQYVESNRSKTVVYENIITNQYSNIPVSGGFSSLIQSGVKNPIGIAIFPFISTATPQQAGSATLMGFSQWGSPQDTCPATFGSASLTNLQVQLGGQNVLQGTQLFYTYENFLEQILLKDKLTSSDLGIGCGLISQQWWEQAGRVYWIDLSRSRPADKETPRSLNLSFTNNSNVPLDIIVITVYLDKIIIDVESGLVRK
jgi:hypothetical protein